jgi:hypothetical protein
VVGYEIDILCPPRSSVLRESLVVQVEVPLLRVLVVLLAPTVLLLLALVLPLLRVLVVPLLAPVALHCPVVCSRAISNPLFQDILDPNSVESPEVSDLDQKWFQNSFYICMMSANIARSSFPKKAFAMSCP